MFWKTFSTLLKKEKQTGANEMKITKAKYIIGLLILTLAFSCFLYSGNSLAAHRNNGYRGTYIQGHPPNYAFPPYSYVRNGHNNGDVWRRNWKRWESLSPAEKERLRRRYKQWKRLPPKKRKRLLGVYRTLKRMPPEERRQLIPLIRRWNTLTPQERGFVLKKLREYGFDNTPESI